MSVALTMSDTTDMVLAVGPVKFLYNCEGNTKIQNSLFTLN